MAKTEAWWPKDLGEPATSGGQNDLRYAFFREKRRLVIEQGGRTTTYDSGSHEIGGVSQDGSGGLRFTDRDGTVDVGSLKPVG
ncbi:MAG: hypothetical protein ABW179_09655 [Methylobacterium sp.]